MVYDIVIIAQKFWLTYLLHIKLYEDKILFAFNLRYKNCKDQKKLLLLSPERILYCKESLECAPEFTNHIKSKRMELELSRVVGLISSPDFNFERCIYLYFFFIISKEI